MRWLLLLVSAFLLIVAGCDSSSAGGAACEAAGLTATGLLTATASGDGFEAVCLSAQLTGGTLAITGLENIDGSGGATQRQVTGGRFDVEF